MQPENKFRRVPLIPPVLCIIFSREFNCSHIEYGYKIATKCNNVTSDTTCSARIPQSPSSALNANEIVRVHGLSKQNMTVSELTAAIRRRNQSEESSATHRVEMSSDVESGIEVAVKKGESVEIRQVWEELFPLLTVNFRRRPAAAISFSTSLLFILCRMAEIWCK